MKKPKPKTLEKEIEEELEKIVIGKLPAFPSPQMRLKIELFRGIWALIKPAIVDWHIKSLKSKQN